MVKLFITTVDVAADMKAGCTALHSAAQKGHNQCARVLLYAGCTVDAKNNVSLVSDT